MLLSALPGTGGHTIFDEVGSLAGAVSYTHVAINVDFQSIRTSLVDTRKALDDHDQFMGTVSSKAHDLKALTSAHSDLMENRRTKLNRLSDRLDDIQNALPKPDRFRRSPDADDVSKLLKLAQAGKTVYNVIENANLMGVVPSIANILTKGVFGNFLSIFSPLQLGTIRIGFTHMIDAVTSHATLVPLKSTLKKTTSAQASTTAYLQLLRAESDFNLAFDSIERSLNDVAAAMQQAQLQRLAIELLTVSDLQNLFNQLKTAASETENELIITAPAHLFQVDTSFVYDGDNACLLVHVPMIPPKTLSTLYKLRPFPIPLSPGNVILPKETPDLLALTQADADHWNIVPQYTLNTCSKINNIHVCPGLGIVRKNAEDSSCLGALHSQKIDKVKAYCDMDIMPSYELAVPLFDDQFLIHSIIEQTAKLECPGKKQEKITIEPGISQHTITEGCRLDMEQTSVYSQLNLRLAANVRYHKWSKNKIHEFEISDLDVDDTRAEQPITRRGTVSLSDVVKHKKRWYQRNDIRSLAVAALAGALAVFLVAGIAVIVVVRYIRSLRNRDPRFDQELAKIREYVEDNLTGIRRASIRIKAPAPPDTPLSIYDTADRRLTSYDPTHQELQNRLNELRTEEPAK
jgi:hypothetical protein